MHHWLLAVCIAAFIPSASADESALWDSLAQGGFVVLMRHAQTMPGAYDPPGHTLEDCNSQRKLSEEGRAQSRRIGEAFRARGIPVARVLSSRYCRCIDTAALAFGAVEPWDMLNNVGYDDAQTLEMKNAALREAVSRWTSDSNLVLVTHGFNIASAFRVYPIQGEMVVIRPLGDEGYRVKGRLLAP
jgi:phosphohistidine phosphatase SixA